MANALDMSLDDLIKNNKQQNGRGGRGRGGGRGGRGGRGGGRGGGGFGRGPGRRNPLRVNRSSPYSIAKSFSHVKDAIWQHDMFEDSMAAIGKPAGPEAGTKLYISNLDFGVTNSDIKELFSEVGELKHCTIHYDRSGRSNGTAEVVYINKSDAVAAVKRYNNVQLDGKPMRIELIGSNFRLPVSARVNFNGTSAGRGRKAVAMTSGFTRAAADASIEQRSKNSLSRGRGYGSRRFRGRGRGQRGRGRSEAPEKSAAELDKELESYHAEAMQTS